MNFGSGSVLFDTDTDPDPAHLFICFDFRKLNSMIKPLNFPITNQKNFFDQAAKYSIFRSVDVRNAFLSIALTEHLKRLPL